jgi:hypothetical protein
MHKWLLPDQSTFANVEEAVNSNTKQHISIAVIIKTGTKIVMKSSKDENRAFW